MKQRLRRVPVISGRIFINRPTEKLAEDWRRISIAVNVKQRFSVFGHPPANLLPDRSPGKGSPALHPMVALGRQTPALRVAKFFDDLQGAMACPADNPAATMASKGMALPVREQMRIVTREDVQPQPKLY